MSENVRVLSEDEKELLELLEAIDQGRNEILKAKEDDGKITSNEYFQIALGLILNPLVLIGIEGADTALRFLFSGNLTDEQVKLVELNGYAKYLDNPKVVRLVTTAFALSNAAIDLFTNDEEDTISDTSIA